MQKATYRPDIEGLRAIAILAVILCHAKMPYMQGGFVGVDIFFVLSGYLITGLLVREIAQTGKVNFLSFYARRFKRLLPGLALMILVSCLAAYILLAPSEQTFQSDSSLYASLWISNIGYMLASTDYFNPFTTNLFLHTWSLGVEEQFYLVWPALILLFMRTENTVLLTWLVLVFTACLGLSIALSNIAPSWGFYSMPSRGWQFALGGIVSLVATTGLSEKYKSATARTLAGHGGLCLILAGILLFDEQMKYPGYAALVPSMGAALILFAQGSPVNNAMSAKPMQAIGKISYSWYLWHWPVFIFGTTLTHRTDLALYSLLIVISLLLAILAYKTVEMPIRNRQLNPRGMIACSIVLMTSGAAASSAWNQGSSTWASNGDQRQFSLVRFDRPDIYGLGCDGWYSIADVNACSFNDGEYSKTAVMLGDSVGLQWFSAFASIYGTGDWRLLVVTKSGCPIADEPVYYRTIGRMYTVCEDWRNAAVKFITELKPELVLIGSAADYELEDWESATRRILDPISKATDRVYVIQGSPYLSVHGPDCLSREKWQPAAIASLAACASPYKPNTEAFSAIDAAAAEFKNVRTLNFNDLVCPDGVCSARNDKVVVFRDAFHVTDRFVRSVTPQIMERIAEAQ
jgi:peptidoglycan/LPS O-acetylase OafA/YrhL